MNAVSIIAAADADPGAGSPRALRLFDSIPPQHVVHAIDDNSGHPFLRMGDIVVVDRRQNDAHDGGLFLVERGQRHSIDLRSRDVVHIESKMFQSSHGEMLGWWMHPPARLQEDVMSQTRRTGGFFCSDGPYGDICHVNANVVGRVIGIYDPIACRSAS